MVSTTPIQGSRANIISFNQRLEAAALADDSRPLSGITDEVGVGGTSTAMLTSLAHGQLGLLGTVVLLLEVQL